MSKLTDITGRLEPGMFDSGQMTYLAVMMAYRYLTEGTLPSQGEDFGWAGQPVVAEGEKMAYVPDTLLTPENVDDFPF